MALRQRLLQDIAELQDNPYPNIILCMQDNLEQACLLLTPNGKQPLHLTMIFGKDYPLQAPKVTIESTIDHPNVYGSYICASILNTTEGYTPAYTLKSIAIQILSFFSSDKIEQEGGRYSVDLANYTGRYAHHACLVTFSCPKCGFGGSKIPGRDFVIVRSKVLPDPFAKQDGSSHEPHVNGEASATKGRYKGKETPDPEQALMPAQVQSSLRKRHSGSLHTNEECESTKQEQLSLIGRILALPDEVLLLVLDELDTGDLLAAGEVCHEISDFMTSYDTIRMRELQCFCLKKNFLNARLGVGVCVYNRGVRIGSLESEFDVLSQQAYEQFKVRRSVQGLCFQHWLPLPISRRHWRSVRDEADASLSSLTKAAGILDPDDALKSHIDTIYNFMNNVVVKLSNEAERSWSLGPKSTLTHASEKAVESYFALFHLLLCLATEQDQMIRDANRRCLRFLEGETSKESCPNLGQLLVAVLISDRGLTEALTWAIINEAILRNVVWMLDSKGKGMAELSYIEPSAISEYRLQRTFEVSKVSYRLLMFLATFYKTARVPGKSLSDIRDEMFDAHGAPPKGTAERMAAEIRNIRAVNNFSDFFVAMGLQEIPGKETLCAFLKSTIGSSVKVGYSRDGLTQWQALALRQMEGKEPDVEEVKGLNRQKVQIPKHTFSFFPGKKPRGKR